MVTITHPCVPCPFRNRRLYRNTIATNFVNGLSIVGNDTGPQIVKTGYFVGTSTPGEPPFVAQHFISTDDYHSFWLLNVPLEHRPALTGCFADRPCHFPSVRTGDDLLVQRAASGTAPLVLVWDAQNMPEGYLSRIAETLPVGLIDMTPVTLHRGGTVHRPGFMVTPYDPETDALQSNLISRAQIDSAAADPELLATGARLLSQWRASQACFAAQGSADVAGPACFAGSPESRAK